MAIAERRLALLDKCIGRGQGELNSKLRGVKAPDAIKAFEKAGRWHLPLSLRGASAPKQSPQPEVLVVAEFISACAVAVKVTQC